MRCFKILIPGLFIFLATTSIIAAEEWRLMRFPDIHEDKIVFTYAGDLWLVSSQGGTARQLTTHPGTERFARFSPDGKYIAFTGQYEGGRHIYVIPSDGGEPRRITSQPADDMVMDWTPDGKKILFRSDRDNNWVMRRKLFVIDINGGLPEPLPLPESGIASFSPDGKKLAYNRRLREFRTWKRYKGGTAQDVWIYDLEKNQIEKITDWEGTDNSPMWHGDKVYFNSDRESKLNLYVYDFDTKGTRKLTDHKEYDVKWPGVGPDAIVYENGGYLYVLDLATEKTAKIAVELNSDLVLTRPSYKNVSNLVGEFALSPSGKRAVFCARGDIFTVPEEKGEVRNITRSSAIREIYPTWSPDGKWVAYYSDRTGEYELYIRPQDGSGKEERITFNGNRYRFRPKWSPDSKKILYTDSDRRIFYIDIEKKNPVYVDQSDITRIHHYSWSPDSKWIAYTKNAPHFYEAIYFYSLEDKKSHKITDDFYDDLNPVFDPDGKYLCFISSRNFSPVFSQFEHQFVNRNTHKLFLITLQADSLSPFAPESDEVEIEEEKDDEENEEEEGEKDEEEKEEESKDIKIDFEGIDQRIVGFPIPAGNYSGLVALKDKVIYLSHPAIKGEGKTELHLYDIADRKDHTLLTGVNNYDVSSDGKKIIYKAGETYGIIEAKGKENKVGDGKLNLSGLEMKIDPKGEWKQMFYEAWRLERDFFYDPNMHGVDWELMKKRYGELLPYVAHRSDLNYLLGELVGELSVSHAYVWGGETPKSEKWNVGLLGADFEIDPGTNRYRFKKIYKGENWQKGRRAPLTEPGVLVKEGDYLISVNGMDVMYPEPLFDFFEKTADKQVKIKVNDKPTDKGAREYTVRPILSDDDLRYLDWVTDNRRKVEEATGGRVGYIHVPNTSTSGLNEFSRALFANHRKDGLIIDVRSNTGGRIPDLFVDRLHRRLLSLWATRDMRISRTPAVAMHGPMVCITNEYAGSGGDAFPYYFRELGLGPLIGTRTWGGLVGISGGPPDLIDGGTVTVPQFAFINLRGEWDVENYGVAPDIEVDNRPDLVVAGRDPQLEKAIEVITQELEKESYKIPPRPEWPTKK
jgi:tricorn protease